VILVSCHQRAAPSNRQRALGMTALVEVVATFVRPKDRRALPTALHFAKGGVF
jgi:hypothetical protein